MLIEHGPDAAAGLAGDGMVADVQGPAGDDDGGYRTLAAVQPRLR